MFGALQRPPLMPINLTYVGFGFTFFFFVIFVLLNRRKIEFHISFLDTSIILFLIIIILTSVFSALLYGTTLTIFTKISSFTFIGMLALYFIVRISFVDEKDVLNLLIVFIITTVVLCCLGILSSYLIPDFFLLKFIDVETTRADSWNEGLRFSSFFGNPNLFASYLILIFPLTVMIPISQKRYRNLFWIFFAIIILIGLLLTFSRSAIIGVLISVIILIFKSGKKKSLFGVLIFLIFTALFSLLLLETILPNVTNIIQERITNSLSQSSFESRINIWNMSKNIYLNYPIGVGYGNYRLGSEMARLPLYLYYLTGRSGHNSFIVTLVENGPFALIALLFIAFQSVKNLLNKRSSHLILALSTSFLGFWIHNTAHTVYALIQVWILLACLENLRILKEKAI